MINGFTFTMATLAALFCFGAFLFDVEGDWLLWGWMAFTITCIEHGNMKLNELKLHVDALLFHEYMKTREKKK